MNFIFQIYYYLLFLLKNLLVIIKKSYCKSYIIEKKPDGYKSINSSSIRNYEY